MNILGTQMQQMIMNPKFIVKAAYLIAIGFGCYHGSKLFFKLIQRQILGHFGKPPLVRDTSKIYTRNIFMIPYIYGRKFIS